MQLVRLQCVRDPAGECCAMVSSDTGGFGICETQVLPVLRCCCSRVSLSFIITDFSAESLEIKQAHSIFILISAWEKQIDATSGVTVLSYGHTCWVSWKHCLGYCTWTGQYWMHRGEAQRLVTDGERCRGGSPEERPALFLKEGFIYLNRPRGWSSLPSRRAC